MEDGYTAIGGTVYRLTAGAHKQPDGSPSGYLLTPVDGRGQRRSVRASRLGKVLTEVQAQRQAARQAKREAGLERQHAARKLYAARMGG